MQIINGDKAITVTQNWEPKFLITMMMIGDQIRPYPNVEAPPMDYHLFEDPTAYVHSPNTHNVDSSYSQCEKEMAALQHYLSYMDEVVRDEDRDSGDAFSSDNFRMFEFKVNKCARVRSHDWTECPFAHPGEKARRRDPRKYHYAGIPCPDFRKGACKRGDACDYAHGVFECWLHPARYRTQPCKDGTRCRRRICFFAHTPHQLRVLPYSSASAVYSPPPSPKAVSPPSLTSINQLAESLRCLQLNKANMGKGIISMSPPSRGLQNGSGFGSHTKPTSIGAGCRRLPRNPNRVPIRLDPSTFDIWGTSCEEEQVMGRVDSGRQLRERMYAKLSKKNSTDQVEVPDLGWVSELVK